MLPGAQAKGGSLGVTDTPFSYKHPLENSVRISKQVYDEETNTNKSSNHHSSHNGCSKKKVLRKFYKIQSRLNPTFRQNFLKIPIKDSVFVKFLAENMLLYQTINSLISSTLLWGRMVKFQFFGKKQSRFN